MLNRKSASVESPSTRGGRRERSSLSNSSTKSPFSLGAVRLNDLLDDAVDEYGIEMRDDFDVAGLNESTEEAVEAVADRSSDSNKSTMLGEDCLAPDLPLLNQDGEALADEIREALSDVDDESIGRDTPEKSSIGKERSKVGVLFEKVRHRGKKLVQKKKQQESMDEATQISRSFAESYSRLSASCGDELSFNRSESSSSISVPPVFTAPVAADSFSGPSLSSESSELRRSFLSLGPVSPSTVPPALAVVPTPTTEFRHFARRCATMPFAQHRLVVLGALTAITLVSNGFLAGLLWGFYLTVTAFLFLFVSEPHAEVETTFVYDQPFQPEARAADDPWRGVEDVKRVEDEIVSRDKNQVVYKGWMNELRGRYLPNSYHVNSTQTVLVRLDGSTLRISRPDRAMLKHAFHTDPTLTGPEPTMIAQSMYDLTGATVSLRPKRLSWKRWWSRKYPIYIHLAGPSSEISKDTSASRMKRSISLHPKSPSVDGVAVPRSESTGKMMDDFRGYDPEDYGSSTEEEDAILRSAVSPSMSHMMRPSSTSDLQGIAEKNVSRRPSGRSIYLFVRAAREKERWFHLLREAAARARKTATKDGSDVRERRMSMPSADSPEMKPPPQSSEYLLYVSNSVQFMKHMSEILKTTLPKKHDPGSVVSVDLGRLKWSRTAAEVNSDLVASANAIATRIFFDFCRDAYWIKQVQEKIQTKLATIHLPYFIEQLELSRLDMGTATPQITRIFAPQVDDWGLWVDFDLSYTGGIRLVIETRVNLMKLNAVHSQAAAEAKNRLSRDTSIGRYSDDEVPESPESSPDEDFGAKHNGEKAPVAKERAGKKLISMVENVAQSSLFKKVTSMAAVAKVSSLLTKGFLKVMEGLSSTRLVLNVEVTKLEGPMTVNLPPPPSDRLWYAFRQKPKVSIRAVPQVGERSVEIDHISTWIESKLKLLLEKTFVIPNMDDIAIPVMSGNQLLQQGGYTR